MTAWPRRALLWGPRVLAVLVCAFLSSFAFDVFSGDGVVQSLPAFAVHLIPVFVLLLAVGVAWRWEWVGAVAFACFALWYAWVARAHPTWIGFISLPLLLVALSYLQGWMHHDELHAGT